MGISLLIFDVLYLIFDDITCIVIFDDIAISKSFIDIRHKDLDDAP
jgi:hypothetical protein